MLNDAPTIRDEGGEREWRGVVRLRAAGEEVRRGYG